MVTVDADLEGELGSRMGCSLVEPRIEFVIVEVPVLCPLYVPDSFLPRLVAAGVERCTTSEKQSEQAQPASIKSPPPPPPPAPLRPPPPPAPPVPAAAAKAAARKKGVCTPAVLGPTGRLTSWSRIAVKRSPKTPAHSQRWDEAQRVQAEGVQRWRKHEGNRDKIARLVGHCEKFLGASKQCAFSAMRAWEGSMDNDVQISLQEEADVDAPVLPAAAAGKRSKSKAEKRRRRRDEAQCEKDLLDAAIAQAAGEAEIIRDTIVQMNITCPEGHILVPREGRKGCSCDRCGASLEVRALHAGCPCSRICVPCARQYNSVVVPHDAATSSAGSSGQAGEVDADMWDKFKLWLKGDHG